MTEETPKVQAEREAFEATFAGRDFTLFGNDAPPYVYSDTWTQFLWRGWSARAARVPSGGAREALVDLLREHMRWSVATFGPGPRSAGNIDHIRKELREIEEAPADVEEWIDVAMLAFDGAGREGHSPETILAAWIAKHAKNQSRKWPDWRTHDWSKGIEHIREDAPAPSDTFLPARLDRLAQKWGDAPHETNLANTLREAAAELRGDGAKEAEIVGPFQDESDARARGLEGLHAAATVGLDHPRIETNQATVTTLWAHGKPVAMTTTILSEINTSYAAIITKHISSASVWLTEAEQRALREIEQLASPMCSPTAAPEIDVWRERMARLRELVGQLARLTSARRISTQEDGWLPIETAPKDRKVIAGYWNELGNWRSVMARYYSPRTLDADESCTDTDDDGNAPEGWYEESETHDTILPMTTPTHWAPLLPAPPREPQEDGEKDNG